MNCQAQRQNEVKLDPIQAEVDALKRLQAETAAELDSRNGHENHNKKQGTE